MRSAIITGGTGLLGSWLIKRLLNNYDHIVVVARSNSKLSAAARIRSVLGAHEKNVKVVESIVSRVTILEGDIEQDNLGLSQQQMNQLCTMSIADMFHSAALAEFQIPYERIHRTNVVGTDNALRLAKYLGRSTNSHSITFHHISTVAIAGDAKGSFSEVDFDGGQKFHNTYEQTKYESEQLVRAQCNEVKVVIYRPGIITGDSIDGITTNFKMLYQPIHFFAYEVFQTLPANPSSKYSFVPVDQVAKAIELLSKQQCRSGQVYHLVGATQVSLKEFVDSVCQFFHCEPPSMENPEKFQRENLTELQWKLIGPFVPYFNYKAVFTGEITNSLLGQLGFRWSEPDRRYLDVLYRYCRESGFVRKRPVASCK